MTFRDEMRSISNNQENTNKNVCAFAVADVLGVAEETRFLHTTSDLVRATRKKFIVRSRKSTLKGNTVGSIRKQVTELHKKENCLAVIVQVKGHVLLLRGKTGETLVDTAPRKKDKRQIVSVFGVFPK